MILWSPSHDCCLDVHDAYEWVFHILPRRHDLGEADLRQRDRRRARGRGGQLPRWQHCALGLVRGPHLCRAPRCHAGAAAAAPRRLRQEFTALLAVSGAGRRLAVLGCACLHHFPDLVQCHVASLQRRQMESCESCGSCETLDEGAGELSHPSLVQHSFLVQSNMGTA